MPNPVHIDLRVQSLVRDLDTLQLPEHDDAMLRENLQEIIEINGTTDPAEQRFKRLLLTQTGMAISLHKRQIQHTNDCIVSRLVIRDEAGNPIKMPWDDAIENLKTTIEKKPETENKPEEPTEEVALGGKFFQLAIFRGKHVSRIVTVAISVLIVVSGIIITVKLSKDQLSSMMQSAITEAVRREALQAKATNNAISDKE